MLLRKTVTLTLFSLILFAGCKKMDTAAPSVSNTQEEPCVQSAGLSNGQVVEGRYIVSYNTSSISARGLQVQRLQEINTNTLSRNAIDEKALIQSFGGEPGGFVANLSESEVARLKADASVAIVEPDRIVALGTCFKVVEPRLITWNIERVGYGDGTGKTAWIIDSGIDFDHPDLNVDKTRSKSFLAENSSADDENGHGTHVAGIIGGKNNNFGVLGVASNANLVSLRVLDKDGEGLLSSIVQALAYINANAAAGDVVNMSVGNDEGISATLDQQVQNTAARGILIAIAAGNEHDLANKFSPGRANGETIFTVSAIDSLDNFANFSNYGNDAVDYAAPGVKILSTYIGGKYAYMSGTSMAAPHMAGLLLLRGRKITTSGFAKNDPDETADPIAHL